MRAWQLFILSITLLGCASGNRIEHPAPDKNALAHALGPSEKIFSLYLVGDAGYASRDPLSLTLKTLQQHIHQADSSSALVYLGDNCYPKGLPPPSSSRFKRCKKTLDAQLKILQDYAGKVYFISGNHDWKSSGRKGWEQVIRQEQYIESKLQRGNTFVPDSGRPGPVNLPITIPRSDSDSSITIQLIALDSQWWLHPHRKPYAQTADHEERQKKIFTRQLSEMIDRTNDQRTVLIGHHPVFSTARHGSKFRLSAHLLPPVFGSLYVLYRKIWGLPQDIAHRTYQTYKNALLTAMDHHPGLIYASGHEHNLQYIPIQRDSTTRQHFIISGAGSDARYVKHKPPLQYGKNTRGFAEIAFYKDQLRTLTFWDYTGKKIYQTVLK